MRFFVAEVGKGPLFRPSGAAPGFVGGPQKRGVGLVFGADLKKGRGFFNPAGGVHIEQGADRHRAIFFALPSDLEISGALERLL